MELYKNILAVTVEELTRADDGAPVISRNNYRSLQQRKQLTVLRPGKGLDHCALVEYASLPARFKAKFVAKYGDPEEIIKKENERMKYDEKAIEFFDAFRLSDGSCLKSEKKDEYVVNASVLNRLQERYNRQRSCRNMSGNTTPINWDAIFKECEALREEVKHTLPKNHARLRDKMRQYKAEGYACLISGKLANTNTTKIVPEAGRFIIALKRSRVKVYTDMQIFEEYNRVAPERGWKTLKSPATITQYLAKPEITSIWMDAVHGELVARQKYNYQHATILPSQGDTLWYGDGTKVNLYYKVYTQGGYRLGTTNVFEVCDAASEVLLGYHISEKETFESMYEAYRMSIEMTGRCPVELGYDGQGGTKRADAKEWIDKICQISRKATPYNGPSKTIESIFGRFQMFVLHQYPGFTGQNITSKSDKSKPNMEFIEANVDNLPTYEEFVRIYAEARQVWNQMKHPEYDMTRQQVYDMRRNENAVVVNDTVKRDIFWLSTQIDTTFNAYGIRFTINGKLYHYDVYDENGLPDMNFRENHTGRKFRVQYDPHDMSVIRLCTYDKKYGYQFITEATPKIEVHRAISEHEDGEMQFIKDVAHVNNVARVRRHLAGVEIDNEFGLAPEQHGFVTPKPKGISAKEFEQICDEIYAEEIAQNQEQLAVIPETLGQMQKEMSNMTFDQAAAYDIM